MLDIGLPDSDGRDVCVALRANGLSAPVLMLTARDGIHDRVSAFESGADDYPTKPFDLAELLVRIAALGRRASAPPGSRDRTLRLDAATHAMASGDRRVALTPTEFRLLAKLVGEEGQVVRPCRTGGLGLADGRRGQRQHPGLLHPRTCQPKAVASVDVG